MKKGLLTMVVALICAMTCAFGLVACNNDTLDGETTEVKGKTYTFVELSVAYSPDFPDSEKADEDAMTALFTGTTLTFGTDGTFEQEALQQTGTYTQNKNEITFTVSDDTFTGMVSGNDLILSDKMELSDSTAFVTTSIKYTLSTSSQTVAVQSVTIDETTLTLDIGDEETLTATVAPDNATNKTVTWSSSDSAVATVANGKVTAVAAGTATITATADGKSATCTVTVNAPVIVDYTVTETEWETAFSEQIKVYTITAEQDGYSAPMVQKFDFNRNIFYLTAMGVSKEDAENAGRITHMIITKEGDNFYYYTSLDAQTWERESITKTEYDDYINQFGNGLTMILNGLKEKYNSFSFTDNSYSAENVELLPMGVMNEATIEFENGQLKSLDFVIDNAYMKMSQHIDFGVAEIEIPTEFTEKAPSTITGNYHNIVKGETGWMLNTSSTFVFNDDGTCEVGVSATYTVENGIVTITASVEGNSITIFATVDGNIMYLFQSKDEVTDVQNSTQFLYNGNEISPDDLAKITEIFGDGVMDMGGKDE